MKVVCIVVLCDTPTKDVLRIKEQTKNLRLPTCFIDNSKTRFGFAQGVNCGITKMMTKGYDLFVVINPDVSLKGLTRREILFPIKYFDIWGLTMRQTGIRYYGGELDQWRLSAKLIKQKPKERFHQCDYVTGSLMIIKAKVIKKLKMLDESYGMYYEDVDFCYRARRHGFKIGVNCGLTYEHFENSKKNKNKRFLLYKNRLKFFLKYSNLKQKFYELFRLPITLLEFVLNKY